MQIRVESIDELHKFAKDFIANIAPPKNSATIITLSGDLGAGKTAFVKAIAATLGVVDVVQSPTFVIERRYPVVHSSRPRTLIHIDAYRLNDPEELLRIRWDETISNPDNIVFLEWPEMVEGLIPEYAIALRFDIIDEHTRIISYS